MESRDASAKGFDLGLFGASSVVPRIPVYKPSPISGLFITVKAYVGLIALITATYNLDTVLLPIGQKWPRMKKSHNFTSCKSVTYCPSNEIRPGSPITITC